MTKIKNTVLSIEKNGNRHVYISVQRRPELLFSLNHKLRIKSILYGCLVTVYSPDMDFENVTNAGWTITEDNRSTYVHDVKIVKSYVKKNKKEKQNEVPTKHVETKKAEYKELPFEVEKIYQTKFQTGEKVLLKQIETNKKGEIIRLGVIYENAKHLGICPLSPDRLIPHTNKN